MTNHAKTSPRPSIFARKGEAQPAPAVAFVSLRQMQGKPERREDAPDRRAQWGERQGDGNTGDGQAPQRRVYTAGQTDHDGRRHYTPRSGLALGQQYVPWSAPGTEAEAPEKTARARKGSPSVATLSALIHRHRDGVAGAAPRDPEPTPAAQRIIPTESPLAPSPEAVYATPPEPKERIATEPTKIDMSYLSASGAQGQRAAAPKSPAAPAAPQAKPPPAARKRRLIRKKVTVRLEIEQYMQIKSLAEKNGGSYQSVMAAAVREFLDKIVRD